MQNRGPVGSGCSGLWVSHDSGQNWKQADGLKGQSIRAFTQSASDPKLIVAGTLDGVFRSTDGGSTWTQISPAGSKEIHEVESIAIDPKDSNIIYAGTWHLPWKTTDGNNWVSMKQGLIDDSDVFSIIIDPAQPNVVYTSACSGIYKSENAGALFHKIQGIPSTARRTRVLMQDPVNHDVVYAGTTEGLYKTVDAGKTFKRMTGPDVIVNDVFVKRYLGGRSPLGARICQGTGPDANPDIEIVGVVAKISYRGVREEREQAYFPIVSGESGGNFYVRVQDPQRQPFNRFERSFATLIRHCRSRISAPWTSRLAGH